MNFLGIGPFELLLIMVIATVVLGPERMAEAGRTLGRLYGQYRIRWQKDVDEMTRELRRELEMLQNEVEEIRQSAESEITAAQTALEGTLSAEIDLDLDSDTPEPKKTATGDSSDVQPKGESAPEAPDPPAVSPSPTEDTDETSVGGESVSDTDVATSVVSNAQQLASDAQTTAQAEQSLEAVGTQTEQSETGEVDGDNS